MMRDLFHRSIEKKNATIKFFLSHPIEYRAANKQFRARAVILREAGFATDISIDEGTLIMYLKYREKALGKTPFEFVIADKFDPFDKNDINALVTKPSKILNKTSILVRPNYGDNHSTESLKAFIQAFDQEMANLGTPLPTFDAIFTRVIVLHFQTPEETIKASELLIENKAKMMS